MGHEGKTSPWEKRFGSAYLGLRIPFGAGVRFAPPKPLAKRLPKFSPNAVPGIFFGWGVHPGGKWTGEYLVAHWLDFQSQGVTASRIPIYTVQEVLVDDLPAGELSLSKLVGDWRFPLAQALDDVTWSLPPSAKKNLDAAGPYEEPEPEIDEGHDGDDVIVPLSLIHI